MIMGKKSQLLFAVIIYSLSTTFSGGIIYRSQIFVECISSSIPPPEFDIIVQDFDTLETPGMLNFDLSDELGWSLSADYYASATSHGIFYTKPHGISSLLVATESGLSYKLNVDALPDYVSWTISINDSTVSSAVVSLGHGISLSDQICRVALVGRSGAPNQLLVFNGDSKYQPFPFTANTIYTFEVFVSWSALEFSVAVNGKLFFAGLPFQSGSASSLNFVSLAIMDPKSSAVFAGFSSGLLRNYSVRISTPVMNSTLSYAAMNITTYRLCKNDETLCPRLVCSTSGSINDTSTYPAKVTLPPNVTTFKVARDLSLRLQTCASNWESSSEISTPYISTGLRPVVFLITLSHNVSQLKVTMRAPAPAEYIAFTIDGTQPDCLSINGEMPSTVALSSALPLQTSPTGRARRLAQRLALQTEDLYGSLWLTRNAVVQAMACGVNRTSSPSRASVKFHVHVEPPKILLPPATGGSYYVDSVTVRIQTQTAGSYVQYILHQDDNRLPVCLDNGSLTSSKPDIVILKLTENSRIVAVACMDGMEPSEFVSHQVIVHGTFFSISLIGFFVLTAFVIAVAIGWVLLRGQCGIKILTWACSGCLSEKGEHIFHVSKHEDKDCITCINTKVVKFERPNDDTVLAAGLATDNPTDSARDRLSPLRPPASVRTEALKLERFL